MHTPRVEKPEKGGDLLFFQRYPEGTSTRGGSKKEHTHHTHMKQGQDLRAAVQEGEERGGGEEGGELVGMLGPSRRRWTPPPPKRKGPPAKKYPDLPFMLRKMTGNTGGTSYELNQELDALRYSRQRCTDGGEVGRRGAAKMLGICPKTLRD